MFTAHFERFVQPARRYPQIWRMIVGTVLILVIYFLGIALVFATIWVFSGLDGMRFWAAKVEQASTPTGTMLLLASFIGLGVAPMIVVKLIHHRTAASLFGPRASVLRDFAISAGAVLAIYTVVMLGWSIVYDGIPNVDFYVWVTFLPLALLGVLVQTGAEELIFRSYFQQQLAARFRSPIVWMIMPSIAFGVVHFDPTTAGSNAWLIVGAAALFGVVAADLTRITGSIGAAWGFHFANNVLAVLFIAVDGSIPGLALYLTPYTADDTTNLRALIAVDFVALIAAWALLRRLLRR